MSFRFRRTLQILPGINLNFGKTGVSLSAGEPGAKVTIGKTGLRSTVGLPGTGLSYTQHAPMSGGDQARQAQADLDASNSRLADLAQKKALNDDHLRKLADLQSTHETQVCYLKNGAVNGPVPLFGVLALVNHGTLPATTQVCKVGEEIWTPLPSGEMETMRALGEGSPAPLSSPALDAARLALEEMKQAKATTVYYFHQEIVLGPVSLLNVALQARAGHVSSDVPVCIVGTEEWAPLPSSLLAAVVSLKKDES